MQTNSLEVPSGVLFDQDDITLLKTMNACGFVRHSNEPFTLKSGIKSHVYVFGREDLTDNPVLEWQVGRKICKVLAASIIPPEDNQVCLIGIPTAGTPFAQAAAMVSAGESWLLNDLPVCHRIMKEKPKDHGAHKGWINGKPNSTHTYWRVDNVATNGDSKIEAEEKFKVDGYPTIWSNPDQAPVFIWIDRQQGAVPRLRKAGFTRIVVAYNLLDLTYAYGELGLWSKSAVKAVELEIEAHKFLPKT